MCRSHDAATQHLRNMVPVEILDPIVEQRHRTFIRGEIHIDWRWVSREADESWWRFSLLNTRVFVLVQVHQLDEQTWRTVEVVPIDIANNEEVAQGVSDAAVTQSVRATWPRWDEQMLAGRVLSPLGNGARMLTDLVGWISKGSLAKLYCVARGIAVQLHFSLAWRCDGGGCELFARYVAHFAHCNNNFCVFKRECVHWLSAKRGCGYSTPAH